MKKKRDSERQLQVNPKGSSGKSTKVSKLATRGTASFKGKSGQAIKKGPETMSKWMVTDSLKESNSTNFEVVNILGETNEESNGAFIKGGGEEATGDCIMGQESVQSPNIPRPPDKPIILSRDMSHNLQHVGGMAQESEVFEDANDQGSIGSVEEDMEIVNETPRL
jgi:hypothetical protein